MDAQPLATRLPTRVRKQPRTRTRRSPTRREQARLGWLLVAPAAIILIFTHVIPLLGLVGISLTDWTGLQPPAFVGARNYTRLIDDQSFQAALRNTAIYVLGYVPPNLMIALALALLLNRASRWSALFRSLYFLPIVVSSTSVAVIGLFVFERQFGLLNYFLSLVDLPSQAWLQDPNLPMPAIIGINIWQFVGYNVVIFLAGLQAIPDELYEAAKIDGARAWSRLWHVTLPLLSPITFYAFITTCIFAFQVFATVLVLTNGGPGRDTTTTLVLSIYRTAFQFFRLGQSASIAMVMFLIVLAFTSLNFRFFSPSTVEEEEGLE